MEEVARLRKAMTELERDGLIEPAARKNVKPSNLDHEIATGKHDIVHCIGHGYWNTGTDESGLLLDGEAGNSKLLGRRPQRKILSGRGIRMVFLNTCNSGRSRRRSDEETASFVSATLDLFGLGAPHVVSIQFPFGNKAAVALARSIYENLAEGKMVEQSVGEAWIAANYANDGQSMNWAIPVAYAQDPGDRMKEGLLGAMVVNGALLLAQRKVCV